MTRDERHAQYVSETQQQDDSWPWPPFEQWLLARLEAAEGELKTWRHIARELLATMNRDGGHRVEEVGQEQASKEAVAEWHRRGAALEQAEAENKSLNSFFEREGLLANAHIQGLEAELKKAEAERDAAIARAEQAEALLGRWLKAQDTWNDVEPNVYEDTLEFLKGTHHVS
jgi:hypothetical protein